MYVCCTYIRLVFYYIPHVCFGFLFDLFFQRMQPRERSELNYVDSAASCMCCCLLYCCGGLPRQAAISAVWLSFGLCLSPSPLENERGIKRKVVVIIEAVVVVAVEGINRKDERKERQVIGRSEEGSQLSFYLFQRRVKGDGIRKRKLSLRGARAIEEGVKPSRPLLHLHVLDMEVHNILKLRL